MHLCIYAIFGIDGKFFGLNLGPLSTAEADCPCGDQSKMSHRTLVQFFAPGPNIRLPGAHGRYSYAIATFAGSGSEQIFRVYLGPHSCTLAH